jgi:ABC-2 type transport system permease protein
MQKVITILNKEWSEVFLNRLVLFSVAFLPLILVAIPLVTLIIMGGVEGDSVNATGDFGMNEAYCQGLNEADCLQAYMLDLFALLFMILPVSIPVTIAAYSIVGEKASRSLEPLLATPITVTELLIGKILAASIPAVAATWLAYLLYVAGVALILSTDAYLRLLEPLWLVAIFVVGPLLTLLAVCTAIMISSRATDPRVAEQLSAVVVLPIILLIVGQSAGLIIIDRTLVLLAAGALIIVDTILVYLAVKLFQREQILTRWK